MCFNFIIGDEPIADFSEAFPKLLLASKYFTIVFIFLTFRQSISLRNIQGKKINYVNMYKAQQGGNIQTERVCPLPLAFNGTFRANVWFYI